MTDVLDRKFLRRREAGKYLQEKYGFSSERALGKLATIGGGPVFRKVGRVVVYTISDLDAWVASRISGPLSSTSDRHEAA
jgi:hypothetical protein